MSRSLFLGSKWPKRKLVENWSPELTQHAFPAYIHKIHWVNLERWRLKTTSLKETSVVKFWVFYIFVKASITRCKSPVLAEIVEWTVVSKSADCTLHCKSTVKQVKLTVEILYWQLKWNPRKILEYALSLVLPIYQSFYFRPCLQVSRYSVSLATRQNVNYCQYTKPWEKQSIIYYTATQTTHSSRGFQQQVKKKKNMEHSYEK